ncbi:MAG: hypothetical protein LBB62_06770 [Proteiniphilum sp.]|jgi:hypothetical protein|nr:hypothetical protein [Proteiniphilum sp.]
MPEHSLTDINNYTFASNFEAIRARMKIPPMTNDYTRLAVTVAYRLSDFTSDLIGKQLLSIAPWIN